MRRLLFACLFLGACGGPSEPQLLHFESTEQALLPEGGRVVVGVYRPVECFLIQAGGSMRRGLHSSFAEVEMGSADVSFDFEAIAPGSYTVAAFGRDSGGRDVLFACQQDVQLVEAEYIDISLELADLR